MSLLNFLLRLITTFSLKLLLNYFYMQIYYLDQLDHELNNCDRISTPRAAFFDKHKVEHITLGDIFTRKDGRIVYGATQVSPDPPKKSG